MAIRDSVEQVLIDLLNELMVNLRVSDTPAYIKRLEDIQNGHN